MRDTIFVEDEGETLSFTRDSLYAYCGPRQIIASALMFRIFDKAFRDLSPEKIPDRNAISVLSGFPGQGIAECAELIARTSRRPGSYLVDPAAAPQEAPDAVDGKLYFEVAIGGRRRGYWPSGRLFDDDFRSRVVRFQDGIGTPEELVDYMEYKRNFADTLYALPDEALLSWA